MSEIYQSKWVQSELPANLIKEAVREFDNKLTDNLSPATIADANYEGGGYINTKQRDAKTAWITDTHWMSGVILNALNIINQENFQFDLFHGFSGHSTQYTVYGKDNFFKWHCDDDIYVPKPNPSIIRKLSVSLQLSEPDEYEGGELQLQDTTGRVYTAPKERGLIIVFDSRARHRVRPIKRGVRKSLVGWVNGPRWK